MLSEPVKTPIARAVSVAEVDPFSPIMNLALNLRVGERRVEDCGQEGFNGSLVCIEIIPPYENLENGA